MILIIESVSWKKILRSISSLPIVHKTLIEKESKRETGGREYFTYSSIVLSGLRNANGQKEKRSLRTYASCVHCAFALLDARCRIHVWASNKKQRSVPVLFEGGGTCQRCVYARSMGHSRKERKWVLWYRWAKVGTGCWQNCEAEQQPHSIRCESRACGNKQFVTSRGSKSTCNGIRSRAFSRCFSPTVFVSCFLFPSLSLFLLTRSSTIRFLPFSLFGHPLGASLVHARPYSAAVAAERRNNQ